MRIPVTVDGIKHALQYEVTLLYDRVNAENQILTQRRILVSSNSKSGQKQGLVQWPQQPLL